MTGLGICNGLGVGVATAAMGTGVGALAAGLNGVAESGMGDFRF